MTGKEEDFRQRFTAIMQDLRDDGTSDPEAMWLLGSLAATLIDKAGAKSWPALKRQLTRADYDGLLRDFQNSGNAFHREGKVKHAYAAQVLGVSLIAPTQKDRHVQAGNQLLDEIIERSVAGYRRSRRAQSVN